MRVVFDTNVLVSYLLTHRPPTATLIDVHLAREEIVPVMAPELLEELGRALQYPKLQRYYTEEERTHFVALLMALSEVVELPETIPQICRDPDDDRFIPITPGSTASPIPACGSATWRSSTGSGSTA